MKNISEKKTIDVTGVNFSPIATFKQGDAAVLKLELFKNGEIFNITGQTVKLGAYRPNKTIVEQLDGFTINNNSLTINLKNNILAVHGIVEVDLTLTDSAGEMTTASFYLKVNKKVLGSDNIAASDEIDSLKQIKIDLTALNENVKREENNRIANEKNRVSEEKTRKANETERVSFYEDIAKPLIEDLSQYDKEIENIYQTIRENDYLPFEGENITIEHSLKGMTKDMVIEGITYQNCVPTTFNPPTNIFSQPRFKPLLSENKQYTLIITFDNQNTDTSEISLTTETNWHSLCVLYAPQGKSVVKKLLSINNNTVNRPCFFEIKKGDGKLLSYKDVMILEGDYINKDVPKYFEGIKSSGEHEGKINVLGYSNLVNMTSSFKPVPNIQTRSYFYDCYIPAGSDFTFGIYSGNHLSTVTTIEVDFFDENKSRIDFWTCIGKLRYIDKTKAFKKDVHYIALRNSSLNISESIIDGIKIVLGNTTDTTLTKYGIDKKEIIQSFENGLKGLVGSGKDTFELRGDGVYSVQRVEKMLFDGKETISRWFVFDIINNDDSSEVAFGYELEKPCKDATDSGPISDKFTNVKGSVYQHKGLSIALNNNGRFYIRIPKTLLSDVSINGLRAWLQANPITVYYELAEPIETKLDIPSLNMRTFNEVTHIFFENSISPYAKFKAPVDVPTTISSLRSKNANLEHENKELKDEINTKTLKLHDQDVELTNSDLDLDFRIFELEMNIGLPINLNIKGVKNMARSPFEMMKILILNNNYDREDIEYKASRYLKGGRITQVEYDEIISLMDANELVK